MSQPQDPSQPPPGWYPDPGGQQLMRWWDGSSWGQHTQPMADQQAPSAPQQPAVGRPPQAKKSHWVRNVLTVVVGLVIATIIISVLSHTSSSGSGSSGNCTTGSCIAADIRQTLVNSVAKDDSVITKMTCDPSSVQEPSSGTYTENCTAAYSDGTTFSGTGTVDVSQNEVTFTPSGE